MRRISKFFHFSCRLSLQFKEFKEVVDHFGKQSRQQQSIENSALSPARVVALLEAAGKIVPFSTCISRALAGTVLMRKYGYSPVLHIGVAKEDCSMLEAHAWLSLDGKIITGNCPDLERYQELPFLFHKSISNWTSLVFFVVCAALSGRSLSALRMRVSPIPNPLKDMSWSCPVT